MLHIKASESREIIDILCNSARNPDFRAVVFADTHQNYTANWIKSCLLSLGSSFNGNSVRFPRGAVVNFEATGSAERLRGLEINCAVFIGIENISERDVSFVRSRLRNRNGGVHLTEIQYCGDATTIAETQCAPPTESPVMEKASQVVFVEVNAAAGGHADNTKKALDEQLAGTGVRAIVVPHGARVAGYVQDLAQSV